MNGRSRKSDTSPARSRSRIRTAKPDRSSDNPGFAFESCLTNFARFTMVISGPCLASWSISRICAGKLWHRKQKWTIIRKSSGWRNPPYSVGVRKCPLLEGAGMFTDGNKSNARFDRPSAPGGRRSPQKPGLTPDRSTIPGEARRTAPLAGANQRPVSQYGTAEEILHVFTPGENEVWDAADFEQAPSSQEEARKANPAALTPIRPVAGFALGESAVADQAALLAAGKQGE